MTLRTEVKASIAAALVGSADFANPKFDLPPRDTIVMETGTGSNLADLLFSDQRTLALSTSEDLDLAASLSDPLGATLTFVKVKAIEIRAAAGNGGNIVVGGAAVNAFLGAFADATDKLEIPAGGAVVMVAPGAGWTVTPGTGDLLKIENDDSGAAATYDIVIVGTSA